MPVGRWVGVVKPTAKRQGCAAPTRRSAWLHAAAASHRWVPPDLHFPHAFCWSHVKSVVGGTLSLRQVEATALAVAVEEAVAVEAVAGGGGGTGAGLEEELATARGGREGNGRGVLEAVRPV